MKTVFDENGAVRAFTYDVLGLTTSDGFALTGSGEDASLLYRLRPQRPTLHRVELRREGSPLYPTMLRQDSANEWATVFNLMARELGTTRRQFADMPSPLSRRGSET